LASGKLLAEAKQIALGARQQRLKSRAALNERLLAEITAVHFEQIKAIDARRCIPPVQQRKEIRLAVTACGNQFAIVALALFGRLLLALRAAVLIQASENLHRCRLMHRNKRHDHSITSSRRGREAFSLNVG
jgi:hypothetical protein